MASKNRAIVFGASGLLGWSVVNQLLSSYPQAGSFESVAAIINRPVPEEDLHLPGSSPQRPGFEVVSGIDLQRGSGEDLAEELKTKISHAGEITHVFYFVFASFGEDHVRECELNCAMMQRVADAVNIISPSLKSFVYSGGTRGYGIYIPGGIFQPPLREELADQLPEDYAKTVAYPWFRKILTEASSGRGWSWTEVCPDVVVGFSPNGSGFSLALHWAQYLSLYALNHGVGPGASSSTTVKATVSFPGSDAGFDSKFTPVSSRMLGRIAIHAALHPETCNGKVVNMMDTEKPITFRELWAEMASWFGLEGVGPAGDDGAGDLKPGEYVAKYKSMFEDHRRPKAVKCGVGAGSTQLDAVGYWLTFNRQLSDERLRAVGFKERREAIDGWIEAFEQFRAAGLII